MKLDKDTPITPSGVVMLLGGFATFVCGGLFLSSFGEDISITYRIIGGIAFLAIAVITFIAYRSFRREVDPQPAAEVSAEMMQNRARRETVTVGVAGAVALILATISTVSNAAATAPGGTFLVPVGLFILGFSSIAYALFRGPRG